MSPRKKQPEPQIVTVVGIHNVCSTGPGPGGKRPTTQHPAVALSSLPPDELPLRGDFVAPPAPAPLNLNADTLRALSVRQPWAELIVRGDKNLEYRSWRLREMGPLLIHASRTHDPENFELAGMKPDGLPFGALVGVVDVVGCVEVEGEPGLYAFELAHPRRFAVPIPYRGAASIFRVPVVQVRTALESGRRPQEH